MTDSTAQRVAQGLGKIATAMRHDAWRGALPNGVTPTQAQVLVVLANHRNLAPPPSLSYIADALAVTAATASDAVSTLADKGLVDKARRGRFIELRLTAEGRRLARSLADWPDFLLEALEQLDAVEQAVFLRSLVKMIRSLQDRGRIPVQRMCVECRYFVPHAHPGLRQPHHCQFVDAPLGDGELRLDCPDQQPVDSASRDRLFELFVQGQPAACKRGPTPSSRKEHRHE
jgi:DNA-binding MarR family transcriptional regulator